MECVDEWVGVVAERLGPLTDTEAGLARSASLAILEGWQEREDVTQQHEGDALGAVVAMVELARSLAAGQPIRRQVISA
jgi:hypothetical protein